METKFVEPVPKNYIWTVFFQGGGKAKIVANCVELESEHHYYSFYDKNAGFSGMFESRSVKGIVRGKEVKCHDN